MVSDGDESGAIAPTRGGDLAGIVEAIRYRGEDVGWWAEWTGLAASTVGEGMFGSVAPTLNNQAQIASGLANLYSDRAAIIAMARENSLHLVGAAAAALTRTELVEHDHTSGWKTVQGIGAAVSVGGVWSVAGALAGSTISLVGFLGENLLSTSRADVFGDDVATVIATLHDEIGELQQNISAAEAAYTLATYEFRSSIFAVHSFDLELYDLTVNDPTGTPGAHSGLTVEVSTILRLAERCYQAGEIYEDLLPLVAATDEADSHLSDQHGRRTDADQQVLTVRDLLGQFLKTTCGRYLLAGDQVRRAAERYVEVEATQRQQFLDHVDSLERSGLGQHDPYLSHPSRISPTERAQYDTYDSHPALDGVASSPNVQSEYVTEEESPAEGSSP